MSLAPPSPLLRRWRRLVVVAAVVTSIAAVVAGYGGSRVFAWQMFPEASRWEADIVRVTADGARIGIEEAWPGGYRWRELVTESGLSSPETVGHAAYGADVTLDALQHALDWVARNTPEDQETLRLEAEVRYTYNDEPVRIETMRSVERGVP